MNLDLFVQLAQRMRQAIEAVPREARPSSLQLFPRASCNDASALLGAYLADCGYQDFALIRGKRDSRDNGRLITHVWLARGRLIIDITADQFKDAPGPIIVTAQSRWHRQFEHSRNGLADFRLHDWPTTVELDAMYERMKPDLFPSGES